MANEKHTIEKWTHMPFPGHPKCFPTHPSYSAIRWDHVTKYGWRVVIPTDLWEQIVSQDFNRASVIPVKDKKPKGQAGYCCLTSSPEALLEHFKAMTFGGITSTQRRRTALGLQREWQLTCFNCTFLTRNSNVNAHLSTTRRKQMEKVTLGSRPWPFFP